MYVLLETQTYVYTTIDEEEVCVWATTYKKFGEKDLDGYNDAIIL